jgi:hypothetical protein
MPSCPRCDAEVGIDPTTCSACGFRFRLSDSTIILTTRFGSTESRIGSLRQLSDRPHIVKLSSTRLLVLVLATMVAIATLAMVSYFVR